MKQVEAAAKAAEEEVLLCTEFV